MTAELVRGQNHALTTTRLEIRVSAGAPVAAGATLSDEADRVRGTDWVAHPGSPALPGLDVPRQAAADHRLAVDLEALPAEVHRVHILLALPGAGGGPAHFGAFAAPFVSVTGADATEIASYTITGLAAESAVVALELYRRAGGWKVRAVGQGYAGGLAELLRDQGLSEAHELAAAIEEAVARGLARSVAAPPSRSGEDTRVRTAAAPDVHTVPDAHTAPDPHTAPEAQTVPGIHAVPDPHGPTASAPAPAATGPVDYTHPRRRSAAPPPAADPAQPPAPVAGDANGWSMEERLYNQVWGVFEDLARTVAAYRSAVDFADSRLEQELDKALSDPRSRIGGQAEAARAAAQARNTELVDRARQVLDRDLAQLTVEAEVVEPALPPAYARWDNPVWHGWQPPTEQPFAVRLGDLHLPESPLRIPMLVRLPLERGLWIDSGAHHASGATLTDEDDLRRLALETALALTARLLAAHPAGSYSVHVIDPAAAASTAFEPLLRTGVLAAPPAAGAAGVSAVLAHLTRRVDLVQMAIRSQAVDSLPPDIDTGEHLLVVNDFPHGFDDRAVTQLRYLADEGPAVGVHLMMIADREESAAYGPLLDPLWRSLMRLTPVADDHLADPWVGHTWTYEPPLAPAGSHIVPQVLSQIAAAREYRR
ncbi:TerD family protein [Streptomyces sp. NA04227]|uniref:TerD family protein n=1 Tax=Streptomyces sp. NA04227 TaxID=2742136 RepID=UPI001590E3D4|nr:TerD family protein [Streptomyces sp. NA04227]QKW05866.1 TerD family protein [Streptomyces sp. NA04227]